MHIADNIKCSEQRNWICVDAREHQLSMLVVVTPVKG